MAYRTRAVTSPKPLVLYVSSDVESTVELGNLSLVQNLQNANRIEGFLCHF